MRVSNTEPVSLIEKVLEIAAKREQQAVSTINEVTSRELKAAAKGYRALADALARKPDTSTLHASTSCVEIIGAVESHKDVIAPVTSHDAGVESGNTLKHVIEVETPRTTVLESGISVAELASRL
jgi:hypothetical protein